MSVLELDAGKYARCAVKDLSAISQAYTFLYGEWEENPGVSLDRTKPCYELYREDWMATGEIEIYAPLV
jgi:DNA gyrase inhibitor GyrI